MNPRTFEIEREDRNCGKQAFDEGVAPVALKVGLRTMHADQKLRGRDRAQIGRSEFSPASKIERCPLALRVHQDIGIDYESHALDVGVNRSVT